MPSYSFIHPSLPLPLSSNPPYPSRQRPNSLRRHSLQSTSTITPVTTHESSSGTISLSRTQAWWIESLRANTRSNLFEETILTYINMILSGIEPNNFAFPPVLKAVACLQDLNLGKQIHAHVFKFGYGSNSVTVANTLVNVYGKCGDLSDVSKVFDRISEKDQVSWNSFISALCMFEEWECALDAFRRMLDENVEPSSFTLVSIALACSNLPRRDGLRLCKQVHAYSLRINDSKTFTVNALIAMYAKLGKLEQAEALLDLFDRRDLVSWNTMLSSFTQNDKFLESLELFREMILGDVKPDGFTLASVLPACSHLEMLNTGKEIHAYALRNGILTENSFVGSALVDMYCNCREVDSGRHVFYAISDRKVAVWNAMITGNAQNEYDEEAIKLFIKMEQGVPLGANATTMASIVPACARSEIFTGKESIHGYIIKRGLERNRFVQNALMDMYARLGQTEIAKMIFESMEIRDIVSWNTMITACVISGRHDEALLLLHEMRKSGEDKSEGNHQAVRDVAPRPNSITLMTVLPGCAALSALAKGMEIHAFSIKNMLATDVAVGSALVDMYAKCGCLNLSIKVFDQMPVKNVITWNVIIMAHGMHGKGQQALEMLKIMVARGDEVKPNEVTFIAVFMACSHSGMVDEGLNLFRKMKEEYGVEPAADHYACIVDLLGRAGRVEEAYELIKTMPYDFNKAGAWSSLLGACRIHQHVEIGEIAAKNLLLLEPNVASHYILLSNIYSSAGLWDEATEVRRKMKEEGVRKEPGCSWIEYGDEVHKFIAGDSSHPQSEKLHGYLESLGEKMREEGYVPDTSCVLHNVDEEEKQVLLCGHSEKLAIAFGILNTLPGTTIRVAKNLRVCNDCHAAAKVISRIVDREIILRDVRRFHHFKNGTCSCCDYW